jgi:DNA polymerase III delta subunit
VVNSKQVTDNMDALSAAASVIAVIQLAQALASGLKDYYEGVRSARAEIQKLYDYLKNLEMLLVTVRNVVHGPEGKQAFNVSQLVSQSGPLGQLHVELQQLARILDVPNRRRKLLGKSLQSLTWPLKQKELEKTLAAIESHKSNLLLVFGLNNL